MAEAVVRRGTLVRSAFVLRSDNMGRRVVSGASFQFLGIALRTLITLSSVAVLARLLSPADFGYLAMATVVTEFAALFNNFGFANVLIQKRAINRLHMDTVFWATASVGAVLGSGVFVASFFADWLFGNGQIGALLRVMCLTFLLGGLTSVPSVVLARLMHFRTQFLIEILGNAGGATVAIMFAFEGFGVWSLIAGALAGTLISACASFVAVPFMPRLRFDGSHLTSTWRTSGSYFGNGLLYYVHMNLDLMLIGRHLGATSLGYYQNARSLTDEIRGRIAIPLQRVLFPAFSAIQTDRDRFQDMVLRSGRLLAAIVIPIGFGVSATSKELVPVLYGDKWLVMIPIMGMFGISAALKAATAIASPVFYANDRVGLALRYNVIGTALMVAGVVVTLQHGINAVAAAVAVTSFYSLVPYRAGLMLIGINFRQMLQMLGLPALAAMLMWLAIAVVRPFSSGLLSHVSALLAFHVVAGALVYTVTLHLLSRQYFRDFKDLFRKLLRKS